MISHMTTHQEYKLALQTFQSQRLRRDLADLAAEPQYKKIGEFFFEEMYGPRDFSARASCTDATPTAPLAP